MAAKRLPALSEVFALPLPEGGFQVDEKTAQECRLELLAMESVIDRFDALLEDLKKKMDRYDKQYWIPELEHALKNIERVTAYNSGKKMPLRTGLTDKSTEPTKPPKKSKLTKLDVHFGADPARCVTWSGKAGNHAGYKTAGGEDLSSKELQARAKAALDANDKLLEKR